MPHKGRANYCPFLGYNIYAAVFTWRWPLNLELRQEIGISSVLVEQPLVTIKIALLLNPLHVDTSWLGRLLVCHDMYYKKSKLESRQLGHPSCPVDARRLSLFITYENESQY